MCKRLFFIAVLWLGVSAAAMPGYAQMDSSKESLVKAGFIYHFVKFVDWPGDKAIVKNNVIDICVMGESGLSATGALFKQGSTPALALSLVQENSWQKAAQHCHILFIGDSEEGHLSEILGGLKGQPVLTVSDIDDFAAHGGMVGFVTVDNKIKFEVNTKSAAVSGLRIDAQLLEIALKVIDR